MFAYNSISFVTMYLYYVYSVKREFLADLIGSDMNNVESKLLEVAGGDEETLQAVIE